MSAAKANKRPASSNWLALQKKLVPVASSSSAAEKKKAHSISAVSARKRRKLSHPPPDDTPAPAPAPDSAFPRGDVVASDPTVTRPLPESSGNETVVQLRRMVLGEVEHTPGQKLPGKYLAIDCEMVGVGPNGSESSLARVSVVNFHGAVVLDVFVKQRERVADYRTQYSGVRASDMVNAIPFEDAQARVAELLKERILVGHAVHNDLKALLLSHPRAQTRDTQVLAGRHKLVRSRYPALRALALQELGLTIQAGEHSSVTDARATMAVFRLHRKEWEKGAPVAQGKSDARKRARESDADADEGEGEGDQEEEEERDSKKRKKTKDGVRRGVSSGLSTVVKRFGRTVDAGRARGGGSAKTKPSAGWWKELGGRKAR